MAGLIGLGQQIKSEAKSGLLDVARQEASNRVVEEQLAQAKAAQEAQTMGTTAGLGAAYGAATTGFAGTSSALGGAAAGGAIGLVVGFLLTKLFD